MSHTEDQWHARIGPEAVPVTVRRLHRVFWVPARYRAVCAVALDGRPMTVRDLAARTGYSVKGAWAALQSMREMGFGRLTTIRGRNGRTRFQVSDDVSVQRQPVNVSTTVATFLESLTKRTTVEETFVPRGWHEV